VSHTAGRGAALLAAVALLAACGGGGSSAESAAQPSPSTPSEASRPVLVIGDSLTVGAELWGDLEAVLAEAGWRAEIVADDGQAVDWGIEQVRDRDTVPDVVVVGLGTNPGGSAETFPDDAATMVAELTARGATTVLWWPPGDVSDRGRVARANALRAAAGGALVVPDWPGELARHPDWLSRDDIHLTDAGYLRLSAYLRDQLALVAGAAPDGASPPSSVP
jgi:lysophospholipase L1-like esterase